MAEYGFGTQTTLSFEGAVERVTEELKKEGFGVLTSIDMQDTLKKKLGVNIGRYMILGACNPPFAHRSLSAEEEIGLLLPCNVIVYEKEGGVHVSAFDPMVMTKISSNAAMVPIAADVQAKLKRVIAAL